MMLYSTLKQLLLPPGLLILMLAAAFVLARGIMARLLIFGSASILLLMSLPMVSVHLMAPLEPYPAITDPTAVPSDVQGILVLSAGRITRAPEYGGDTVDALTLGRIRYAAYLARATGLPLYVSGGSPEREGTPIAELMAGVLRNELGVQVAGVESRSQTSWENAAYSKGMLERDGIHRVLLVSSAWHMPRVVETFERSGVAVVPASTGFYYRPGGESSYSDWLPTAKAFLTSYYAIHEHVGRVWYQIRTWLTGPPKADEPTTQDVV